MNLDDFPYSTLTNSWHDTIDSFGQNKIYAVQTARRVIERCMLMTTMPGDLVLDPTCGSGTTAHVAEQWGRHDADDGVVAAARRERREGQTDPQRARRAVDFGVMIVTGTMAWDHVRSRSSLRPWATISMRCSRAATSHEKEMFFRLVAV